MDPMPLSYSRRASSDRAYQHPYHSYDAYLFDIDGTLLNCHDSVHYFSFCDVLSHVAGVPMNLDGVQTHGNTDVGIIRDAFVRYGIEDTAWRPQLNSLLDRMATFVELHRLDFQIEVLPAVIDTLDYLAQRQAALGIATGNLERIGRMKLAQGNLDPYFQFGGFSDAFEFRVDVFRSALEYARGLAGNNASVCVFGDTPADINAARALDLDVVAVATGTYPVDELKRHLPSQCVPSLRELIA